MTQGEREITEAAGTTSEESEPLTATTTSSDESAPEYAPAKMKLMIAVSQSNVRGYPLPSNASKVAFEWTMDTIVRSSYDHYKIFIIHVQVPQTWIRKLFSLVRSYCADIRDRWFFGVGASDLEHSRAAESPDPHRQKVLDFMDLFEGECRLKNIEYESLLKMGCPKKVICEEVKNVKPELLVLGSRGLGDCQRLFRPSVGEYCAKYAEHSVIIRIKRPRALIRTLKGIHLE